MASVKSNRTLSSTQFTEIDAAFEFASHKVVQSWDPSKRDFTKEKMNLFDLKSIKAAFIPEAAVSDTTLFIEPKKQHDFILNTAEKSPAENTDALLTYLKSS